MKTVLPLFLLGLIKLQHNLNNLTSEQLHTLQRSGYLQVIYMAIASLEQIPTLLHKKWALQ